MKRDYSKMTGEEFENILKGFVNSMSTEDILSVAACYTALQEHFYNEILRVWEERNPIKCKLTLFAVTSPDYFQGSSSPYLQVPVWQDMTKEDLTNEIVKEWWNSDDWAEIQDDEMERMCDEFILADFPFSEYEFMMDSESEENDMYAFIRIEEE